MAKRERHPEELAVVASDIIARMRAAARQGTLGARHILKCFSKLPCHNRGGDVSALIATLEALPPDMLIETVKGTPECWARALDA